MSDLSAWALQGIAAMNARTYAMDPEDRERWFAEHPVRDYQAAIDYFRDRPRPVLQPQRGGAA